VNRVQLQIRYSAQKHASSGVHIHWVWFTKKWGPKRRIVNLKDAEVGGRESAAENLLFISSPQSMWAQSRIYKVMDGGLRGGSEM
jgi:hypothetical protein